MIRMISWSVVATSILFGTAAAEKLKIAIPQAGVWESSITVLGEKAGIFQKEGIELEILNTRGGSETVQAVLAGSVDMAHSNGILGAIGGFAKGAPLRIVGAAMTGAPEVFWYVPANSPIKTIADLNGKKIGYSRPGSSTHLMVLSLAAQYKLKSTLIASGGPSGSFTQTMSGQIDAGWSSPPYRLQDLAEGKIRIIARGTDIAEIQNQTIRVNIARTDILKSKREALTKYMRAWVKSLDYCYTSDKAIEDYAAYAKISRQQALDTRDKFHPKKVLLPFAIGDLELSLKQAHEYKFTSKLLKPDDVKGLIDLLVTQ